MPTNSFLFNYEPDWKPNHPMLRHLLPYDVQSWVYEAHSLTQRLRCFYGDSVKVKILFHQWKTPFLSEVNHLHLRHQRYSLVREVLLHADDKPLILARTILPKKTINIAKRNLSHLGTRPLGEVIFSYPHLERLEMDVCCVKPETWSNSLLQELNIEHAVWGRRTVYAIQQQPLLVSELFLPDALKCL
ncbi:MAG: chorismate lyase [Methylococcaceae bacterium]|nr:chorismate lyase [Methylococcaceae bacterium]